MSAPEITKETTDITYEGVTYSIVPNAKSEGRVETCPRCGGTGIMYSRKCRECHGHGQIQESA